MGKFQRTVYAVSIAYHAISSAAGTMLAEVNSARTGFYVPGMARMYLPGIHVATGSAQAGLPVPSAGTGPANNLLAPQTVPATPAQTQRGAPPLYPAGKSITGDLSRLQVNAWLSAPNASYGTVAISNLQVTGCLAPD